MFKLFLCEKKFQAILVKFANEITDELIYLFRLAASFQK